VNAKQKTFCEEYLIDLNATQAAIRAGYSEKTAYSIGHENLSKPEIAKYIAELKEKRSEDAEIDAAWVLRESVKTYQAASNDGAHTAATSALKLVGQHVDVKALVERRESKVEATIRDASDEELEARLKALREGT
jgi:phage terminase small subunit